ncbi:tumor protein D52 isoform X4 [Anguilla anguilla]|uniref:tumor protein D52 isoform X4 n=1 Tax=Anguilla anguilla TaxID=7936 RepID=UPI0015A772F0|nr:tumor protein D52 isoform X4 [Anguilla anguilla]
MDPAEDYKSPFNFEQGVNASYLYLSPTDSVTPPGSPGAPVRGTPRPDSIPEVGEDAGAAVGVSPTALTQEEQEELRNELAKVEDEIQTLSQVLAAKEKHVAEIKRKLGLSPLNEFKQNISKSWQEVTTSVVYRRTSETLSQAGQKASAAFTTVGSAISRKLEDVSIHSIQHSISMPAMRNTPTFKSFEGRVDTLKTKISPAESTGDFGEVLNSTASATPAEAAPEVTPADSEEPH